MKRKYRLLFGPIAGAIFFVGITGLALLVPGYSQVRQTVSEIGEVGSTARVPFAITLCCVAACIMVFALGVRDISVELGHSQLAAYFIGFMALPAAGTGIFAYPHPLHNVFGLSELISYQAPLVLALTWRRNPRARPLVSLSWILYLIICAAIALNLSRLTDKDRFGHTWNLRMAWRKEHSSLLGSAGAPSLVCYCFKRKGKGLPALTRCPTNGAGASSNLFQPSADRRTEKLKDDLWRMKFGSVPERILTVLFVAACSLTVTAQAPERRVENNMIISERDPKARIELPKSVCYVGADR
jgi:hypothetical membrane protein